MTSRVQSSFITPSLSSFHHLPHLWCLFYSSSLTASFSVPMSSRFSIILIILLTFFFLLFCLITMTIFLLVFIFLLTTITATTILMLLCNSELTKTIFFCISNLHTTDTTEFQTLLEVSLSFNSNVLTSDTFPKLQLLAMLKIQSLCLHKTLSLLYVNSFINYEILAD